MDPKEKLLTKFPECLRHVSANCCSVIEERGIIHLSFALQSHSGAVKAQIFGHKLSSYNSRYKGEEFISPIRLQWPGESSELIFDSECHGYHGMLQSSAKLRGRGDAVSFVCPACAAQTFEVRVQFDYMDGVFDICTEELNIDFENYFSNFLLVADCEGCGKRSVVTDMDL